MTLQANKWAVIFTIYLRYLIGASFIYAFAWKTWGMMDATAGSGLVSADNPVWATFQCIMNIKYLWLAAAYGQLVAGILLTTQRFSTLGAVLFTPIIVCICLITWSVGFNGTKYLTLLMLLAVMFLLWWDKRKLLPIIHQSPPNHQFQQTIEHHSYWIWLGIIITAISIGHIWYQSMTPWLIGCFSTGLLGLVIFLTRYNKSPDTRA